MDNPVSIAQLQKFVNLITAFGKVERIYNIPGTERKENDLEHSYMLAMIGWYLAEANTLTLSHEKILKYALAHDVVEVYAGDTYVYSKNQNELDSKPAREAAAAEQLKEEHPEFSGMHSFVQGYVDRTTPEAKFVYALDKLLPIFLIYADGGRSWREHAVTLEMIIENKASKVAISPEIQPYFDEIIGVIRENKQEIFTSR